MKTEKRSCSRTEDSSKTARRKLLLIWALLLVTLFSTRAGGQETTVAIVNGHPIHLKEVDDAIAAQILPLLQQIHALRKRSLENLILRTILEDEAKRRRISVEELRRQLVASRAEVVASQVEQLYVENAQAFGSMSPDEAKERLRLDLEGQQRIRAYVEAVTRLRQAASVSIRFPSSFAIDVRNLDASPTLGQKNAPITIVEFSDYQCTFCRGMSGPLKEIMRVYEGRVRLVMKHLPLTDTHPLALKAAQAAFCAGVQGSFWQYHEALFAADELLADSFEGIARRLKLDIAAFNSCRESDQSRIAILEDMKEAKRLGIIGTPAFIINGKLTRGAISVDDFKSIIERELQDTKQIPPPP